MSETALFLRRTDVSQATLLALGVLAAVMLVGCSKPIDSSDSDVRVATTQTTYCYVHENQSFTGHVDWFQTSRMSSYYVRSTPLITLGYTDSAGLAHPRMNGFCTFEVPHFESEGTPACTLFYYQSAHSGSADLRVNWLDEIALAPYDYVDVFWNAWNSTYIVATDDAQSDGWHAVPLTTWACEKIAANASEQYPDPLITGWTYRGSTSGTYADVVFRGANATYIKVVYEE